MFPPGVRLIASTPWGSQRRRLGLRLPGALGTAATSSGGRLVRMPRVRGSSAASHRRRRRWRCEQRPVAITALRPSACGGTPPPAMPAPARLRRARPPGPAGGLGRRPGARRPPGTACTSVWPARRARALAWRIHGANGPPWRAGRVPCRRSRRSTGARPPSGCAAGARGSHSWPCAPWGRRGVERRLAPLCARHGLPVAGR